MLVAKELADNALDACGNCRVGDLEDGGFFVEDDGPGIDGTPEEIATLFSINRPLISSKVIRLPTRGALGNGLRVVAGVVLASGGRLDVFSGGRHLHLTPQESTGETLVETEPCDRATGTRVEVGFGDSVPADEDYLWWARLAIDAAGKEPIYKGNSSVYWYESDAFFELLQAAGNRTVRDVVSRLDGFSGNRAGEVASHFSQRPARSLSFEEAEGLLGALRNACRPVKDNRIKLLGKAFAGHYRNHRGTLRLEPGRGSIVAQLPCTVEAWISPSDKDRIQVLVNRTPITGDIDIQREKKRDHVGIFGCGLHHRFKVGAKPVDITLNIQIPFMPITTDGKEPNLYLFFASISQVIEKAARSCQRANATPRGEATHKANILDNLERAIGHASGGQYRFSIRTLFYSIRHFLSLANKPLPTWGWFCKVITEYEEEQGSDIPDMYRDNRGKIYVPHEGLEIPLGTLSVENYEHQRWTYNKVLYIEKEGLYEILKSAKWPERHDCLLVTSQGYATRATKDVIDLLGESDGELLFFAAHDGDAYGTCIYESLQQATAARRARVVKIINLGLEPWQGLEMGLAVEPADKDGTKRKPVGHYVRQKGPEWVEWLQTQRIELNAMTTPQFLEWLDEAMREHGNGKLIPPKKVMRDQLHQKIRNHVRESTRERILRESRFEAQVDERVASLNGAIGRATRQLANQVRSALAGDQTLCWKEPVERLGVEIATKADDPANS
jgi:hypothetical protein